MKTYQRKKQTKESIFDKIKTFFSYFKKYQNIFSFRTCIANISLKQKKIKFFLGILILLIIIISFFIFMPRKKSNIIIDKSLNDSLYINPHPEPGKVTNMEKIDEDLPANSEVLLQGRFVSIEQNVLGKALFAKNGNDNILRLEDFESIAGQDVHVYLSPIPNLDKDDVIDLGLLKSTSGNFNYPLDKLIDIQKYNNVLIWSNTFDAFFAYASLSSKELPEIQEEQSSTAMPAT